MADKPEEWKLFGYKDIIPEGIIKTLDKAIDKLSAVINTLSKFLKLLAFFISAFNSFSFILQTFIKYVQRQINLLGQDLVGTGIYANILVPPDFSLNALKGQSNLSQGGYEGFLQRLKISLNNSADKNAPQFSETSDVGGLILLLDTETLYDFFKGMEFILGMFDFMDLFPINTSPPPPINLRGSSGYFKTSEGDLLKLGVKLEWDAPNIKGATHFRISRSIKPGGIFSTSHKIPTKLIGPKGHEEEGIIQAALIRLTSGSKEWPATESLDYNDPLFNEGKPKIVLANPISGGGSFIDFDIDELEASKYYYVIESGFSLGVTGLWGERTPELMVPTFPTNCISPDLVGTVEHPRGYYELVSSGSLSLGQWTTIQISTVIPFMPKILEYLNKYIDMLSGALKTNTKSFTDFLNGVVESVERMKLYLEILIGMIVAIENFFSGLPLIGFLNVPLGEGGTEKFMERVTNATRPEQGFSGPSGYTMGIVFVYGISTFEKDDLLSSSAKKEVDAQIKAIQKAFELITKILS